MDLALAIRMLVAAALVACGSARAQTVVELRPSARIAQGKTPTLDDIALVTGDQAAQVAQQSVAALLDGGGAGGSGGSSGSDGTWKRITAEDIRRVLDANVSLNAGRLSVRGAACEVLVGSTPAPVRQAARPAAASAPTGPNVRDLVIQKIAALLEAGADDLRLSFSEQDADLLGTPITGRTVEIQGLASGDKLPLLVRVFEHDRIVAGGRIRVDALVRRQVLVSRAPFKRGEPIAPEALATETQWLAPSVRPASLEQASNAVARNKIDPGDPVMADDVEPPIAVKKGEVVAVDCLSGGIIIKGLGRALATGRTGDVIEFEAANGDGRRKGDVRTYKARISGPGHAVTVTTAQALAEHTPARHDPQATSDTKTLAGPAATTSTRETLDPAEAMTATAAPDAPPPSDDTVTVGGITVRRAGASTLTQGDRVAKYWKLSDQKLGDGSKPAATPRRSKP